MVNPTGYTALDLVGYTDRGTYAATTNYVKNDLAHHNGIIWRCLIDDTIGITPVEGVNWTVFINAGSAAAEEIIAPIETSPAGAAHTSGTQLIYNDTLYDVIANISIGDSLTVGTNIQAAPKISSQIQTLTNNVGTLTTLASNKPKNRRVIVIADSLGNYTGSDTVSNFMTIAKNRVGFADDNYFQIHQSGQGIVNDEMLTLLQSIESTVTDHDTITDIYFCVGFNDMGVSESDINTGLSHIKTYVDSEYPNSNIHLVYVAWNPYINDSGGQYRRCYTHMLHGAIKYGFKFINNFIAGMHYSSYYLSDGVHPSTIGVDRLGDILASCILNDDGFVNVTDRAFAFSDATYSGYWCWNVTPTGLNLMSDSIATLTPSGTKNISKTAFTEIATLSNNGVNMSLGDHNGGIIVMCEVTSGGTTSRCELGLKISANKLYLINLSDTDLSSTTVIKFLPFFAQLDFITC